MFEDKSYEVGERLIKKLSLPQLWETKLGKLLQSRKNLTEF